MVVEHEFVTTRQPQEVMGLIGAFLSERGFIASAQPPFAGSPPQPAGPHALEMRRGKKKPTRARRLADLPQAVMAEYDRGRVEVAYMVQPWRDKTRDLHTRAAFAMVTTLDQLVTGDPVNAAASWASIEQGADAELSRSTRRYHIILYTILAVIVALLATIITVAVLRSA